jgi:26S proteasome regulatory subunit N1
MGLGIAYVGTHRVDLVDYLSPIVQDESVSMEIASFAALALGFIFVGSANGDVSAAILQTFMERCEGGDKSLDEKWAKFLSLGLGLIYLGKLSLWSRVGRC